MSRISRSCSTAQTSRRSRRSGAGATWEHRLGDNVAFHLQHAEGSIEEVRLRGTFNVLWPEENRRQLLAEVRRILLPGGRVMIHGLVTDRPLPGGFPRLPGPAPPLDPLAPGRAASKASSSPFGNLKRSAPRPTRTLESPTRCPAISRRAMSQVHAVLLQPRAFLPRLDAPAL